MFEKGSTGTVRNVSTMFDAYAVTKLLLKDKKLLALGASNGKILDVYWSTRRKLAAFFFN